VLSEDSLPDYKSETGRLRLQAHANAEGRTSTRGNDWFETGSLSRKSMAALGDELDRLLSAPNQS